MARIFFIFLSFPFSDRSRKGKSLFRKRQEGKRRRDPARTGVQYGPRRRIGRGYEHRGSMARAGYKEKRGREQHPQGRCHLLLLSVSKPSPLAHFGPIPFRYTDVQLRQRPSSARVPASSAVWYGFTLPENIWRRPRDATRPTASYRCYSNSCCRDKIAYACALSSTSRPGKR